VKRRDILRQELVDKRDVVRRASRETARRQRALEERKRSDEEAEMRRREEVLELRRQQQREAMNMMRNCRRNGLKTHGVERDVEVRIYGKGNRFLTVKFNSSLFCSFLCLSPFNFLSRYVRCSL
jgi:hypothetical protein